MLFITYPSAPQNNPIYKLNEKHPTEAICFCGGHWQRKLKDLTRSSCKIRCRLLCAAEETSISMCSGDA